MADSTNGAQNGVNGGLSYAERYSIADHFIGGNRLANAPASNVKDFVAEHDGHTVITNVSRPALGARPCASDHDQRPMLILFAGSHCQQRYCRRQGDPIRPKMGV